MIDPARHFPVMSVQVLKYLNPQKNQWYLDATLGDAGHTQLLLEAGAKVIAFEQDIQAVDRAVSFLKSSLPELKFMISDSPLAKLPEVDLMIFNTNFAHLEEFLSPLRISFQGILFDLGVSTFQLTHTKKGLSFVHDSPLDMRLDQKLGVTAADLLAALSQKELIKLFTDFSDEPYAFAIARKIVKSRQFAPITTTTQLADLVTKVKPRHGHTHPATQVFQALRIAVNSELDNLVAALASVINFLQPKGHLVVISFHSGEDRLVKRFLSANTQTLKILTDKPLTPSLSETNINPSSRSAKLRAAYKNES